METESVGDAEVDVCTVCRGIWIDWFDGEIRKVARTVVATERARGSVPPPPHSPLRAEANATGACPRCTRQLTSEPYVVHTTVGEAQAHTSVSQGTGADLLRCEECAGVFVPRASAGLLATLPADEEPPPSSTTGPGVLEPLPWQRFMAVVRRVLGLGG